MNGTENMISTFLLLINLCFCVTVPPQSRTPKSTTANSLRLEPRVYEWYIDNYWGTCGETEGRVNPTADYSKLQDSRGKLTKQPIREEEYILTTTRSPPAAETTTQSADTLTAPAALTGKTATAADTARPQHVSRSGEYAENSGTPPDRNEYVMSLRNGETQPLFINFPSEAQEARSIANQDRLNRELLAHRRNYENLGPMFDTVQKSSDLSRIGDKVPEDLSENGHDPSKSRKERDSRSSVVGGNEATKRYPWIVAFVPKRDPGNILCAGSLITDRHVLSAAHCFDRERDPAFFGARVGVHNISEPGETIDLEKIVVHPEYEPDLSYSDIAMVFLARKVTDFKPICLPVWEGIVENERPGAEVKVFGFGSLASGLRVRKTLQVAELELFSNGECSANYSARPDSALSMGIIHSQLCAGPADGYVDACQNDSGGPLVNENKNERHVLLGIVSFGYQCAREGLPGVYTRVTAFLPWIIGTTRERLPR